MVDYCSHYPYARTYIYFFVPIIHTIRWLRITGLSIKYVVAIKTKMNFLLWIYVTEKIWYSVRRVSLRMFKGQFNFRFNYTISLQVWNFRSIVSIKLNYRLHNVGCQRWYCSFLDGPRCRGNHIYMHVKLYNIIKTTICMFRWKCIHWHIKI